MRTITPYNSLLLPQYSLLPITPKSLNHLITQLPTHKHTTLMENKKNIWSIILKVVIAVATTIAGALGISSCM